MLVYRLARRFFRASAGLYFVDVQSEHAERVPETGPVVFTANHPNSLMDTVLLGGQVTRPIRYMARSGLFDNPLAAAAFHAGGVIPIYRAQDAKDGTAGARNDATFAAAYDALAEGGRHRHLPGGGKRSRPSCPGDQDGGRADGVGRRGQARLRARRRRHPRRAQLRRTRPLSNGRLGPLRRADPSRRLSTGHGGRPPRRCPRDDRRDPGADARGRRPRAARRGDDLLWSPAPASSEDLETAVASGVKSIGVKRVAPPPLER